MLKIGQALVLSNRRWQLRSVRPVGLRKFELEAIGASEASQGLTRHLSAYLYGDELFIEQRRRYWRGHLQADWVETDFEAVLHCRPATALDLLNVHTRYEAAGDLKNEFSWSFSRAAKYSQCPRAYYYHYYAAWEGWREEAPQAVKQTYLLKNLTDLPRWSGRLVHETIKFALARLKAGQPVPPADLVKQMHTRAQADFAASRQGHYRQRPGEAIGFQEHYYGAALPRNAWQRAWAQAEQYLQTFLRSELYAYLQHQPVTTFLAVETLQSFVFNGVTIWLQMDLARREGSTLYIYDWKTGTVELEAARRQLAGYGLYFRQTQPEVGQLRGLVYSLAEDQLIELALDEALLNETEATIVRNTQHLRHLLFDPLANLAELSNFPMVEDLKVCRTCQFRELCGR